MRKNIVAAFLIFFSALSLSACRSPDKNLMEQNASLAYDELFPQGEFVRVNLPVNTSVTPPVQPSQTPPTPQKRVIQAKVARTDKDRETGLMFLHQLPHDMGMIFLFPKADIQSFWMKNTLIPLDIIFIDAQMKIVNIAKAAQPCKKDPCPYYKSTGPALYVLEINGGLSDALGLKVGDKVDFAVKPLQ